MGFNPLACVCGGCVIPQRYVLCFMLFMGIVNSYGLRACLNLALTEIVVAAPPKNDTESECQGSGEVVVIEGGTYNWTQKEQGLILGAFFPGYVITHLPGGFAADEWGGKHVFGAGVFISALMSILTPASIEFGGPCLLAASRFIMGFAQGALFPACTNLLAKWVPKRERGTLGTLVLTGPQIGSFLANIVSGYLMALSGNWPIVFYFWGILSLIWYVFYLVICTSAPENHPFITANEKEMLATEIGISQKYKIPWKKLFLDGPCIALAFGQIGHGVKFFFFVTNLPKYMKDVLKFNIKENGVVNAIPYIGLWITSVIAGVISDRLINNGTCSVGFIRKLYTTIASVGPSTCIVIAGYMGCDRNAAAIMFIVGLTVMGPFYPGLRVNGMDVTKNFAGVLTAFVNGAGALAYVPIPYMIAIIAKDNTFLEYQIVFWIIWTIASVTNIIYVIWASGERADWDINAELVN